MSTDTPQSSMPTSREPYLDLTTLLRQHVKQLTADGATRLPSEEQLSTQLGVSRPTVRSALLSLQKEGLLQRSHGRGTFINRHAVRMPANLSAARRFRDIIHELGHEPGVSACGRCTIPMPADIARKLERPTGAQALVIERLFTASGQPAVYAADHVPADLLTDVEAPAENSVFDFLERHAGRSVRYSVADVMTVLADDDVATRLGIEVGAPLLLLLHTHIDSDDEPVAVTRAFVRPGLLTFSMVRTYRDI